MNDLVGVLRSENPKLAFVTLALRTQGSSAEQYVESIVHAFGDTIAKLADDTYERDFVERDGVLHISRAVEACYFRLPCVQQNFAQADPTSLIPRTAAVDVEH